MRVRVAGVLAPIAVASCGVFTSLDGFSDGATKTASDAGASPGSAQASEASSEQEAGAGAGRFCAGVQGAPVLCFDFDDELVPPGQLEMRGGGVVSVDRASSSSPPASMLFTVPAGSGAAALARAFPAPSAEVVLEMDFIVEELGDGDAFDIITFGDDNSPQMGVEILPNGALQFDEEVVLSGGGEEERTGPTSGVVRTGWSHLKWTSRIGASVTNDVELDGKLVGSRVSGRASFEPGRALWLGDENVSRTTKPWRVRIDNAVLFVR